MESSFSDSRGEGRVKLSSRCEIVAVPELRLRYGDDERRREGGGERVTEAGIGGGGASEHRIRQRVEELEGVATGKRKSSEVEKNEFEVNIEKMKAEISVLQSCLDEKERVIRELEADSVSRGINGEGLVDGGRKGTLGGLRQRELMFMGGSAIVTAAVMGCYIHATRKH